SPRRSRTTAAAVAAASILRTTRALVALSRPSVSSRYGTSAILGPIPISKSKNRSATSWTSIELTSMIGEHEATERRRPRPERVSAAGARRPRLGPVSPDRGEANRCRRWEPDDHDEQRANTRGGATPSWLGGRRRAPAAGGPGGSSGEDVGAPGVAYPAVAPSDVRARTSCRAPGGLRIDDIAAVGGRARVRRGHR